MCQCPSPWPIFHLDDVNQEFSPPTVVPTHQKDARAVFPSLPWIWAGQNQAKPISPPLTESWNRVSVEPVINQGIIGFNSKTLQGLRSKDLRTMGCVGRGQLSVQFSGIGVGPTLFHIFLMTLAPEVKMCKLNLLTTQNWETARGIGLIREY